MERVISNAPNVGVLVKVEKSFIKGVFFVYKHKNTFFLFGCR